MFPKAHSVGVMHLYHKSLVRLLYHQNAEFRRYLDPLYGVHSSPVDTTFLDNLGQQLGNLTNDNTQHN
jgi:hypothetical protein